MSSSSSSTNISTAARIRKRPVSFGNPALGTYKGHIYTFDGGFDLQRNIINTSNKPLVEDAEPVECMVAMVNVPPEQVPEGILNLARSHRPFIDHVRIVIAEAKTSFIVPTTSASTSTILSASTTTNDISATATTAINSSSCTFPSVSAMESAASILAAESTNHSHTHTDTQTNNEASTSSSLLWPSSSSNHENDENNNDRPSRTYLVLFHLLSEQDAKNFVQDLNGRPFTSLDETVTCHVHHVLALQGEDGVSLLNPMFAPQVTTRTPPHGAEILPSSSSAEGDNDDLDPNCAVCLDHMSLGQHPSYNNSSQQQQQQDHPNNNNNTAILTTVCNHTFHLDCLVQCQDSPCPVCRYDHSGLNETLSQCHACGTTEHNYVCLICGVVSCVGVGAPSVAARASSTGEQGQDNSLTTCVPSSPQLPAVSSEVAAQRFYTSHAGQHYNGTLHAYALDTETQHVWDFAGQGYVHRLLQNKDDGKLVEVHDPSNTTSQERSLNPGLSDAQEGEVVHRKLEGFASQYYTLLKSQLEQQRIFYQGRLQELRREFALQQRTAQDSKADLVSVLKQERKQLSQRLVSLKRRREKVVDDVAFLKSMNESFQANKAPLQLKIQEAQQERSEAREMIQKYLPALEQKVTSLMLQLEQESISNIPAPTSSSSSTA